MTRFRRVWPHNLNTRRGGNRRDLTAYRKKMSDCVGRRKNWRDRLNSHLKMYFVSKFRAEDLIQVSRKSFSK
jgi:hypothetical protein